jgi:predicted DNA-binding transcriptional regulator AlpA
MDYLTAEQTAVALGISRETLYSRIKQGVFPSATHRAGRRSLWLASTVADYAAQPALMRHVVPVTAEARALP